MLVQLDSSEINSPINNSIAILSRCTTVESNLTSATCLCHSEYMTVSFLHSCGMNSWILPWCYWFNIMVATSNVVLSCPHKLWPVTVHCTGYGPPGDKLWRLTLLTKPSPWPSHKWREDHAHSCHGWSGGPLNSITVLKVTQIDNKMLLTHWCYYILVRFLIAAV